jgi:NifU-like protein involved in Fe-S cluster formation
MLIHIANAGQYLQMKVITHFSISILAERAKGKSQDELRQFLNESNEMDEEMRLQLDKVRKTHPGL